MVAVTTMSHAAGPCGLSASRAPVSLQNARRRRSFGDQATTFSIVGTAARIAGTWAVAWKPVPISPRLAAPGRARYRAATPLAAAVRIWLSTSRLDHGGQATFSIVTAEVEQADDEREPTVDDRVALEPGDATGVVDRAHDGEVPVGPQ